MKKYGLACIVALMFLHSNAQAETIPIAENNSFTLNNVSEYASTTPLRFIKVYPLVTPEGQQAGMTSSTLCADLVFKRTGFVRDPNNS